MNRDKWKGWESEDVMLGDKIRVGTEGKILCMCSVHAYRGVDKSFV